MIAPVCTCDTWGWCWRCCNDDNGVVLDVHVLPPDTASTTPISDTLHHAYIDSIAENRRATRT